MSKKTSKTKPEPMVQKSAAAEPPQKDGRVQGAATPPASLTGATKPPAPSQPSARPAATVPKEGTRAATPRKKPAGAAVGRPKAKRSSKRSGMSGLDAAAKVLSDAGKPMRCQDVVERVLAKGLWKTSGKTPAATIHSAVIREIKLKGKQSRFKKAGRGLFAAR